MAFLQVDDGIIYFVSPPYRLDNRPDVDENVVENAVNKHGFVSSKKQFQDWPSVILYLKAKFRDTWENRKFELTKSEALRQIIQEASEDTIEGYLDRIENEFIPQRNLEHALNVLLDICFAKATQSNPELQRRTRELHDRVRKEKQKNGPVKINNEKQLKKRFSLATKFNRASNIAEISKYIAKNGLYAA